MSETTKQADAVQIAEFMKLHWEPRLVSISGEDGVEREVLVCPPGLEVTSVKDLLDEYKDPLERVKGCAELTDLDSFIAHVKRFQDDDSALFAHRDPKAPSILAVFDYHRPSTVSDKTAEGKTEPAKARYAQHRARYSFPLADEWAIWSAANGKAMSQADFANFLEDRIADVVCADDSDEATRSIVDKLLCTFASPSRLIDLAKGLSVRVESIVANKQDLQSGESVLRFETRHQDDKGAPLDVPGAFLIAIPVFRGGARYQLAARLRYRIKEGKISWWFELYRATETFDHAFLEACSKATKETELPLFMGKPEA